MRILDLSPTVLFRWQEGRLIQVARLLLQAEAGGTVTLVAEAADGQQALTPLAVPAGESSQEVAVPDIAHAGSIRVSLIRQGECLAEARFPWRPQRKWTVHLMPTSHIDLYSTGLAEETPEEHAAILDAAMAVAQEFPSYCYQIENMLPIFEYRQLRPKRQVERLVELIRAGRLAFGAQYTGLHHEEASGEELVQGQLNFMRELEAAYGIRPNCGYTVDVPNATMQYFQLLHRCGIPYWIFSPNRYPPPDGWYGLGQSLRRLPPLLRAKGLDDSSVLAWLPQEHYSENGKHFGLDGQDVAAAAPQVDALLKSLEASDYPLDTYLLECNYGDNLPPTRGLPALLEAWSQRYAYPRLVAATADQFFRQVEEARPPLPELRLEVLDVWAFVVANQGVLNPLARRALHALLGGQALWSLAWLKGSRRYPEGRFRRAFSELAKFVAHDWWYGGGQVAGVPDLAKAGWAQGATKMAAAVLDEAVAEVAGRQRPLGATVVLNPCPFPRTDVVLAPRPGPLGREGGLPCQVVDGETVASHFRPRPYTIAQPPEEGEEGGHLALLAAAPAVPALGHRQLALGSPQPSRRHRREGLENRFYRLQYDRALGGVGSIIDKESGRELVDVASEGWGQLLLGQPQFEGFGIGFVGTREEAIDRMRQSLKSWQRVPLRLSGGLAGPVFSSLVLSGQVHTSPVTQAIILYEELRRIEVTVRVEWDNQPPASRLVVAFPFALAEFDCRYEIPFGVLHVGRDEAPTVPRHLRQMQTWLRFASPGWSVVIASPDVGVFSLGRCDLNPVDDGEYTLPQRAAAYFILADNGGPSPLVQPGRLAARFALTSGPHLRPSDCARFAWGLARPLLAAEARPANQLGPIAVRPDSLLISTVKRAWDGDGLVVRVVDYDGVTGEAALGLPFVPREAWLADPNEHPLSPVSIRGREVHFPVRPHEVLTFVIKK